MKQDRKAISSSSTRSIGTATGRGLCRLGGLQALVSQTLARIETLEAFNGRYFYDLEGLILPTPRRNGAWGVSLTTQAALDNQNPSFVGTITISASLSDPQLSSLTGSFTELRSAALEATLEQTRGSI